MELHACETCGLQHAHPGELPAQPESPEVAIARINAERDVKVAQLQRAGEREWNEARVEVAEVEAEAEVASAEATAEIVGEVLAADAAEAEVAPDEDGDPEVVVVDQDPEPDVEPPPEDHDSGPREPKKKSLWPMG